MGRSQKSTLRRVLKKFILTLIDDFGGFKTVEQITAHVLGIARELELKVEFEDVTKLLQSNDKTLMDERLLLINE